MGLFISCSAARLLYISSICLYRNASAAKARRIGRERMGDTVYRVGELALSARERQPAGAPKGIVLALHGGGYGAGYWDFSPTSLLDVAAARGHLGVAIHRPGSGAHLPPPMPPPQHAHAGRGSPRHL